jgi:hypothetical protein
MDLFTTLDEKKAFIRSSLLLRISVNNIAERRSPHGGASFHAKRTVRISDAYWLAISPRGLKDAGLFRSIGSCWSLIQRGFPKLALERFTCGSDFRFLLAATFTLAQFESIPDDFGNEALLMLRS